MCKTRLSYLLIGFLLVSGAAHAVTTLVATPSSVTLNYTKGGTLPTARVTVGPSAGTTGSIYFTLAAGTLPSWLQVDKTTGTASTTVPVALTFSPSLVATNNPAGSYTGQVQVDSAGLPSIFISVTLNVANATPTVKADLVLSTTNWMPGSAIPTGVLTVKSSGDPVYLSLTATPSWILLGASSAVAYSWGTNISVNFAQSAFDNPTVNAVLSGTIGIKVGTTTLTPIAVSITVGQPVATITSISPKALPQNTSGAFRTIAVQGSNFANLMTVKLGGVGGTAVTPNCATFASSATDAWCLQSSQQFFLRLSPATLASAATLGNQLDLYLSADPNGHISIPVVTTPIVYAVTDAASFQQPAPGSSLNIAPYEMLSFFGDNFGASPNPIAFTNGRLPNALADASLNPLRVHFTDSFGVALPADTDGYLLLWTPTQINVLVPSSLPPSAAGNEVKATVTVGANSSGPASFNVVAASPALLTFGAGQAVVVNADNSINTATSPARFGSNIVLYLSGMGVPAAGGSQLPSALSPQLPPAGGCADFNAFQAALTGLHPWQTIDGAIVDSSVLGTAFPPCLDPSTVSIKIGNVTLNAGAVAYAGFTADSIAGLYQVNVSIPASAAIANLTPAPATTSTGYPIQLTIGGAGGPSSQTGVNIYLAK